MSDLGYDVEALMIDARAMTRIHILAGSGAGGVILFAPPEPKPDQGGNYVITSQGYGWQ